MKKRLLLINVVFVLITITISAFTLYLYFRNQNTKKNLSNPCPQYSDPNQDETIAETNDWKIVATQESKLDYFRTLYLINKKDINNFKILGTVNPFLYPQSAVFLNQNQTVAFIQTSFYENHRLYPQKEKIVFYSITQDKIEKIIERDKILNLLSSQERKTALSFVIGNLIISPDKNHIAFNLTNSTAPNGWIFFLNLKNGKISRGPEGINQKWKDNQIIEYKSGQLSNNNIYTFRITN